MGGTREIEREIETTFAVEDWFVLPPLREMSGVAGMTDPVEIGLEAVYYDTADLRLARDNVTVRRREGGDDEGWHLKLPVGPDTRDEIRRPLTGSHEVPGELSDLVRAHAGDAPLAPVARILTTRTARRLIDPAGHEVAELVDDQVRGQTLGARTMLSRWREVEIESLAPESGPVLRAAGDALLRAGATPAVAPSKLAHLLALAGRPPTGTASGDGGAAVTAATTAGEVVARYLWAQIDALVAADPRVRRDEPEAVHDMRVAIRRLRATLRTFGPLFDPDRAGSLQDRLRGLGELLGVPRDAEVQLARFTGDLADQPPERVLGPVLARVEERLRGDRLRGRETLLDHLRGPEYPRLLDDLRDFAADPEQTPAARRPAGKVLRTRLGRAERKLSGRAARAFAETSPAGRDAALHQARKAAKRLRYAAEAVEPVYGRDAARIAKAAKRTQNLLGEHQDCVVARGTLMTMALAANAAGESSFTYGLLLGGEEARGERTRAAFAAFWPAADRTITRRHRRLRPRSR